MWWCVLTMPGISTRPGRLRVVSALLNSAGRSAVLPTHCIWLPLTKTAASVISPRPSEKVARVPMSCSEGNP